MWLKCDQILTEQGFISGFINIQNQWIHTIESADFDVIPDMDFSGHIIIPGLIDIHLHGYKGLLNPIVGFDLVEFELFLNELAYQGTTACLPSIEPEFYPVVTSYRQQDNHSMLMGLNLEAYFSCEKYQTFRNFVGQPMQLSVATVDELMTQSNHLLKYVMIAPELKHAKEAILRFKEYGVSVAVGHTTMSADQFKKFQQDTPFDALTHTGNNMGSFHQRDVGVLGAGLLHDTLMAEVITDMVHLSPDMIEIILKLKTPDRCLLISDSVFLSGLPPQTYNINQGKNNLHVGDDLIIRDFNGDIQGCYHTLFENTMTLVNRGLATLEQAVNMASLNPARFLKMDATMGTIARGKYANLLVINKNHELLHTFVCGKLIKRKLRDV